MEQENQQASVSQKAGVDSASKRRDQLSLMLQRILEECSELISGCSTQDPYKSNFDGGMGTKMVDLGENREQS